MKKLLAIAALTLTSCVHTPNDRVPQGIPEAHEDRPFLNLADQGTVEVSDGAWEERQLLAVDGNLDTWWSADDFAPQWIELTLSYPQLVGSIELITSQVAPGPATHRVRLERDGDVVAWHRFDTEHSIDGHVFSLRLDPPLQIDRLRVSTTRHVGWVAWREVRIFSGFLLSELVSGMSKPVQLMHAGDGSGRIFVVEKGGRIRIVKDKALVEAPFLDISPRVLAEGLEQGLMNVAFPPSYVNKKRFYVSYTDTNGDTVISRFSTSADPDRADPLSEEVILTIEQPGEVHNGGTLMFGPRDGYLYIGSGDGGYSGGGPVPQTAQESGTLLGKILRIDVESGAKPYAIPADNPFVSRPDYAPEIWALGLRNPWGFAFDPQRGDLFIPDPGWHTYEEVNFQPADGKGGENYGWPQLEGPVPQSTQGHVDNPVLPVAGYRRWQGCAIVGGAVYEGQFIYADFCTGTIWSLRRQGSEDWQSRLLVTTHIPTSGIGADESGNLYAVGYADGKIYPLAIPTNVE